MSLRFFHHPDISLPVIRRRVSEELLELVPGILEILATRGRSLEWQHWTTTRAAYDSAVYRLRKMGLVASRDKGGGNPKLELTAEGLACLPVESRPHSRWRKRWNETWYVLVYDVPEREKEYRNTLRSFLKRMRMGCLQRSVWVTPFDVRPEYDDLAHAAAVEKWSFLLEASTVLGRDPQDVVVSSWDFERLGQTQRWYCEVCDENLQQIREGKLGAEALAALAREERVAYHAAMSDDPLLPTELWPAGYLGRRAFEKHGEIIKAIGYAM